MATFFMFGMYSADALDGISAGRSSDAETTIRPALAGSWRNGWRFPLEVKWDVGINFIQDYRNVLGDNRTQFVGNVGVLLRTPRWEFGLR